ncbi:DUF2516 family protein [Pseudokineococcus marinus]|uniref:DUF2516 family protein n=1 Tax=Pseudokineococcus marinus TaxID=351215 RepID=A0A849BMN6_9ACTN|nr:DUF2516 family protein [Pseudokineococcus marinus]NNH24559.1 DUF2516 family protein [Pseudokineococcus marinus]
MSGVFAAQGYVTLLLGLAVLAVCVFALVDAVRRPAGAFAAAGKLTKNKWVAILAVASLISFAGLGGLGLIVISLVAGAVYLADVRPALRSVGGGGGGRSGPVGW